MKGIDDVENKIPDISILVTTTVLNTKIGEAENKIPDFSGLVKRTDCDGKISDIRSFYKISDILLLLIIINLLLKYLIQN